MLHRFVHRRLQRKFVHFQFFLNTHLFKILHIFFIWIRLVKDFSKMYNLLQVEQILFAHFFLADY